MNGSGTQKPSGSVELVCQVCRKVYSRKDSLNRHTKMHENSSKIRKRSCHHCRRTKIKCSGERPRCAVCARLQISCTYPVTHTVRDQARQPSTLDLHSNDVDSYLSGVENVNISATDLAQSAAKSSTEELPMATETHNPSLDTIPEHEADLFSTAGLHPLLSNDSLTNYADNEFDWIFRNDGEGSSLNGLGWPAHYIFGDQTDSYMGFSSPAPRFRNGQESGSIYKLNGNEHQSWLLDGPVLNSQPLEFPELGTSRFNQSATESFHQLARLSESDRARLQRSLQIPLERPLWKAVSFANFPSTEKLDHCIDLFFANFNTTIGFIHRPTFDPKLAANVVLLAIASIGARFSRLSGAASFANAIAELNRRNLLSMSEQDFRTIRSESFITAQILQSIYGYCSGESAWFHNSENLRCMLVRIAKQSGLFLDPSTRTSVPRDGSTESQWMAWIATERRRRLGWTIYELDASVSFLHNERPSLSVGEVLLNLPDDAVRWEAPSAHAWKALRPSGSDDEPVNFRIAARSWFDTSLAESVHLTDQQHIHIAVITLAQLVWTLKETQASPLVDAVPEPWPLVVQKATLLSKLDQYPSSPHLAKASDDDRTIRCIAQSSLVINLSHLYGASDLMDWLPALLASSGHNEAAKMRMTSWGQEDQERLRKVVYHCAQILAICRDFPFNTPAEPTYAFYAGGVLWCAASLLDPLIADTDTDEYGPQLTLDKTTTREDEHLEVTRWIQKGGNVRPSLCGVPWLGSKSSPNQVLKETVRVLQNMRVWHIAQAYAKVLRRLQAAEVCG